MIAVTDTLRVPIGELNPYPRNPRNGDIDAIAESIRKHGQYRALVVNRPTMQVLAGNHTLHALHEVGAQEALVHFVDVDEEQAARIVLVDNRSNDLAGYNDAELLDLLQDLPDLEGTGYDQRALEKLVAQVGGDLDPEGGGLPPVPVDATTKPGDLYVMGDHRLLCGDSTVATDVDRLMGGALAQMVFTDPPYGVGYEGGQKKRRKLDGDHVGTTIYGDALPMLTVAADPQAALYLWYADAHAAAAAAAAAAAGYRIRAQIIWLKNNAQFVSAAHYKGKHECCYYAFREGQTARWYGPNNEVTVWEADRAQSNDYHPTQKPVALAQRAIRNSSAHGDIVLDLFGGSGSTLIAAEQEGRKAYLMELDPAYCDVIVKRWENLTGKTAELVRDDG